MITKYEDFFRYIEGANNKEYSDEVEVDHIPIRLFTEEEWVKTHEGKENMPSETNRDPVYINMKQSTFENDIYCWLDHELAHAKQFKNQIPISDEICEEEGVPAEYPNVKDEINTYGTQLKTLISKNGYERGMELFKEALEKTEVSTRYNRAEWIDKWIFWLCGKFVF